MTALLGLGQQGTSSYYFDDNGNLVEILPPGADGQNPDGRLRYGYDQRNLLITSTLHISGTGEVLQVAFIYDGAGNRVQQVDYRSGQTITTTYTNDNSGLSQVLVSDDGATQTHNMFGLSLIHQDNGAETRALLADGLGSVRLEMVDGAVDSANSYEPFGSLLTAAGETSVFQFAGEAADPSGLTFLRPRYLDPGNGRFLSRDPWAGDRMRPQSMNGWNYVENNPINLVDPSGRAPATPNRFPEHCRTVLSEVAYDRCLRDYFKLGPVNDSTAAAPKESLIGGSPGCYWGAIPYRAPGYVEGVSAAGTVVGGLAWGREVVYDFATMERQRFEYFGIAVNDSIGLGGQNYVGVIAGFRSWPDRNITEDYSGWFNLASGGVGLEWPGTDLGIASTGIAYFEGHPDTTVYGGSWYYGAGLSKGAGLDLLPLIDVGISATYYTGIEDSRYEYFTKHDAYLNGRRSVKSTEILSDISSGKDSPWVLDVLGMLHLHPRQAVGRFMANGWIDLFDQINYYAYAEMQ